MDERLDRLISDYLAAVDRAVRLMDEAGIARPDSAVAWALNGIPQKGLLPGRIRYMKHGYGCAVHFREGAVDFDFGEQGQIDGLDLWRLAGFAEGRLRKYGFASEKALKAVFQAAVDEGWLRYSGYILYYRAG